MKLKDRTFCRRIPPTEIGKMLWGQLTVCLPCTYITPWTAAMTLKAAWKARWMYLAWPSTDI